jgi:hypothetical protein
MFDSIESPKGKAMFFSRSTLVIFYTYGIEPATKCVSKTNRSRTVFATGFKSLLLRWLLHQLDLTLQKLRPIATCTTGATATEATAMMVPGVNHDFVGSETMATKANSVKRSGFGGSVPVTFCEILRSSPCLRLIVLKAFYRKVRQEPQRYAEKFSKPGHSRRCHPGGATLR